MDAKKIGEKIRDLRERSGYTKVVFAKRLGCSYSTVCSWEYGERIPSDPMKVKIADFFNVPINIFFEDK